MNRESLLLNYCEREAQLARRRAAGSRRADRVGVAMLLGLLVLGLFLPGCSCTFAPVAYQHQAQTAGPCSALAETPAK